MDKYVIYDSSDAEHEELLTFDKAKQYLKEIHEAYLCDDGIDEYVCEGGDYIAKITHRSKFIVTDEKSNYDDPKEWPHSDSFDRVGYVEMVEVDVVEFDKNQDYNKCDCGVNVYDSVHNFNYCPNCGRGIKWVEGEL